MLLQQPPPLMVWPGVARVESEVWAGYGEVIRKGEAARGRVEAAPPGRKAGTKQRGLVGCVCSLSPSKGLVHVGVQCRFEYTRDCVIGMLTACILIIFGGVCASSLYRPMI